MKSEAKRKPLALAEPCCDPNPWVQAMRRGDDPPRPCGRPFGHGEQGYGDGANWGSGHSEFPGKTDPPTRGFRFVPAHWVLV